MLSMDTFSASSVRLLRVRSGAPRRLDTLPRRGRSENNQFRL